MLDNLPLVSYFCFSGRRHLPKLCDKQRWQPWNGESVLGRRGLWQPHVLPPKHGQQGQSYYSFMILPQDSLFVDHACIAYQSGIHDSETKE